MIIAPYCTTRYDPIFLLVLGEEPFYQLGLLEGPFPNVVTDSLILGVTRIAAGFLHGRNHSSRFGHGNVRVGRAMERPDRDSGNAGGTDGIAAATEGNRSGKQIGLQADQVPGSKATH